MEEETIYRIFESGFNDKKNKRIAIYGIGENTRIILQCAKEYNIVGLLDGVKKDGLVYGFPVIDIQQLKKENVDIVIIIARSSNIGIIMARIKGICEKEDISIYDIQGRDLLAKSSEALGKSYYQPDEKELIDHIEEVDVVSFDIFDTLLMRKTLYPTDVFEVMIEKEAMLPKDFANNRILCERELLANQCNPTIYDVYDKLQKIYGWSDKEKKVFLKLEVHTDCRCIVRRECIYSYYKKCIKEGKKVYLLSDMYYTHEILCYILEQFDICGYEKIYVSCEYNTSKSKHLFDIYISDNQVENGLHIGDDLEADIDSAKKRNLKTFHIYSARQLLEQSNYAGVLNYTDSLSERVLIGCFIARLFNNPFDFKQGKGIIRNAEDYGYAFVAPLVFKFCSWLLEKCEKDDIKSILFSSRDGYLFYKSFASIRNSIKEDVLPESIYFYASRMAYTIISLYTEDDIKFVYDLAYDGTIEDMLYERFKIPIKQIEKYDEEKWEDRWQYVKSYIPQILENSKKYRKNFYRYLETLGININEQTAFFDFVSSGTCHRCLQTTIRKKIPGYYFSYIYSKNTSGLLDIKELFHTEFGCISDTFLCNNYLFLENIFSAPEATLKEFNEDGQPIFFEEDRTEKNIQELEIIHNSVLRYIEEVLEIMGGNISNNIKSALVDEMFSGIVKEKTYYAVEFESNVMLKDEFCKRDILVKEILRES